jgi:protein gp37
MSAATTIEWTQGDDGTAGATWNPVTGCTKVSPGCDHCYAETFAERWRGIPGHHFEHGFDITLRPERIDQPLRWKQPRRIFVNSMSDLWIDAVPDEFIAAVWTTMFRTSAEGRPGAYPPRPAHTYQILTKRPGRMRNWARRWADPDQRAVWIQAAARHGWCDREDMGEAPSMPAVLPNVWLGVSAENQKWFGIRVPILLQTPAAVRFVSCEPLLGPIDMALSRKREAHAHASCPPAPDWVVIGGESGRGARPMELAWAREIIGQCRQSGAAPFVKQVGSVRSRELGAGMKGGDWERWPEDLKVREFPRPVREEGDRQ